MRAQYIVRVSVLALAAAAAPPAYAQTATSVATAQDVRSAGTSSQTQGPNGEIIVTAERRSEPLQQTPLAITAVNSATLQTRAIQNIEGLTSLAPNLNATTGSLGGDYVQFYIRGVGQVNFDASSDPGVALYIDGVYLGRTNGADLSTLDVAQIEVLRGPQGTLFGKNTVGGAINIITQQPTDQFSGSFHILGGSRDHAQFRGTLNIPINEQLQTRFSVNANTQDGYGYNIDTGSKFGSTRSVGFRGAIAWTPTDRLSLTLNGDYTHKWGTSNLVQLTAIGTTGAFPDDYGQYIQTKGYGTFSSYNEPQRLNVGGVSLDAKWELSPDTSIRSISAYRALRQQSGTDFDGGPGSIIDEGFFTRQHQLSEELQIGGKALDKKLDWVGGVYLYKESTDQSIPLFAFTPVAINEVATYRIFNVSGFGQLTYRFNDLLSLTAGVRYTHEHKKQAATSFLFTDKQTFYDLNIDTAINTPAALRGATLEPWTDFSKSWDSFTPRATLEYKPTHDLMLYATYSKGFKSGGFNARESGNASFASYQPETLNNFEVGFKSQFWDHKITFNGSAFYDRYSNLQLYLTRDVDGALVIETENAAKARLWGFEGELAIRPLHGLQFDASAGYLNTKYLSLNANALAAGIDYASPLPQAPKLTLNLGGQYSWQINPSIGTTLRLDYTHKSRYFFFATANPLEVQPSYGVFNTRIEFDIGKASISAFVKNLANKYYWNFREDNRGVFDNAISWPAEPRTFGVELGYKF